MPDAGNSTARQFAANLRRRRSELGMSQDEAATRALMDQTYWSKVETLKKWPGIRIAALMAQAVETTLSELAELPDEPSGDGVSDAEHEANEARFRANVITRRKSFGMSMSGAAGAAGMDPAQWRKIEQGRVSPGVVVLSRMARALRTTPTELLRGVE